MSGTYSGDLNHLLSDASVVAIVATQRLRPADGPGAPFFPPTYLGSNDRPTYCISSLGDSKNLCTVDSVQSQANRIEEAFLTEPYRSLVRKVEITAKLPNEGSRTLDMLQLGHRLADAAVTFSTLAEQAHAAMRSFAKGPEEVAKLSPMSLLCGLWESRGEGTQLKIPRAFGATITARDVRELRRMATFTGSFWSKELGLEGGTRSAEGLDPVPVGEALGGVIAEGEILRTATLNLIALRQNCKVTPGQSASAAANYVYGLGLVAMTMQPETFLRQGCLLVADGEGPLRVVTRSGKEEAFVLTHADALGFAQAATEAFGVKSLPPLSETFQTEKVEKPKAAKDKPARGK
jgi:CRISPR-associated protein Csb1